MTEPLAVDLFCGLGGWTEGLLAEGYNVVGFDNERHCYGEARYPAQLVIQDVLTLHGAQFKDAALIVASPPCQAYSYRAMPWKRAKALPPPSNELFEACFRIQREACEAATHHIPLVVENVCGAQKWVGRARWHYWSFYLWGDVPALMPIARGVLELGVAHRSNGETNFHGSAARATKNNGGSWFAIGSPGQKVTGQNPDGRKMRDVDGYERTHPNALGWKIPRTSSHSKARKAASAHIAKIPYELARHIGRAWYPMNYNVARTAGVK